MPPLTEGVWVREWMEDPEVGAIAPSSPELCKAMVAELLPLRESESILELGPGTGRMTRAMMDAGIHPQQIVAIERSAEMAAQFERRYPTVELWRGDALGLRSVCRSRQIRSVLSSLPNIDTEVPRRAFDIGVKRFVQFTYKPWSPIKLPGRRRAFVWRNLPPAWVWVYDA
jgi:phosphatidylethanolamine/phosphatidyl-N-methylethanolamine N-methyltransferase